MYTYLQILFGRLRGKSNAKPPSQLESVMDEADKAEITSFEIPASRLGVHVLYEPKVPSNEITADIIAVHGLGGDSFSTWTDQSAGKLWLRDFLPNSPSFHNARILTYGYDSRAFITPFTKNTTGRVFTFGEEMLGALSDERVRARGRPIIFLGHSLGGIVIKSAMVYAHSRPSIFGDIYSSVKAILFFGTPHQGADAAVWLTYLGHISKAVGIRRANVTRELQTWSNELVELSTMFSEQIPDLLITTFFEMQPIYGVVVVPEGSARLGQRNETIRGLNENHRTICKYATPESPSYRAVLPRFEAVWNEMSRQAMLQHPGLTSNEEHDEQNDEALEERLRALRRDG